MVRAGSLLDKVPLLGNIVSRMGWRRTPSSSVTTVFLFVCFCLTVSVVVMIFNHEGNFDVYFRRQVLSVPDDLDPELEEDVPAAYRSFVFAPKQVETTDMDWWERQVSRKEHIRHTCERVLGNFEGNEQKAGSSSATGSGAERLLKDMTLDPDADILFCPSMLDVGEKAAKWETLLAHASSETLRIHYPDEIRDIEYTKPKSGPKYKTDSPTNKEAKVQDMSWLKRFTKILFVEHPFEKIVALYRNRIQNRVGYLGYEMGKRTLVYARGFRNLSDHDIARGTVTFPEMMSFVVHRDFLDPHVKSVYEVCAPCHFDYDYVVKAETFADDIRHIFKQIYPGAKWKRMLQKFPSFKEEDYEKVERTLMRYYTSVREEDLLMLYDLYSIDMFMFNYEWPFEKLRVNKISQ
ncbi:hypothetical protein LSH36_24g06006 [Paralvinella palmiformis]|uniref:Carbohydrate sulfotransferase n=1 Tax=Paralvinella palmiformis TaxID=53620 RepID=A0AAD9NF62_9ANNE|nr:hypothetical protein LSH36_24g06006 [Paralvinella palmiformis]